MPLMHAALSPCGSHLHKGNIKVAKSKTSDIIKLKNVRLSFPRLFKAKAFQEGQEPRYEATFLLDPSKPEHATAIAQIKEEAKKLVAAMWGEKPAGLKLCFGLADNDEVKKKYDGYQGMFYITSANTERPGVYGRQKQPLAEGDREAPYAGCYVNTNITLWTQDNKFGKGVRCNLRIVQFSKDGDAFSGAAPARADEELEALEDTAPAGKAGVTEDDGFDL